MYVYEKSLVINKNLGSKWENIDISNFRLIDIFSIYRKAYVTLSNYYLEQPIVVDLDTIKAEYVNSVLTLNEFFIHIGNRTLIASTVNPNVKTNYAVFSDAFRAGYKIEPQNIYASNNANLPFSEKTSLRINRPNPETDMKIFFDHCLVSINGYFHRTDTDNEYAYALNANESLFKSKQNQIGILSFLNIGKIEQVSITPDMISKQTSPVGMKNKTFIKLNKDITNKTVMLVLGGYLLFVDNKSFFQINDDTFALNFNEMPLLERYFESNPYLNLKHLGLPESSDNISLVNVQEFFSDEVLTKYLTLSQTFFVVLDSPSIFTNKIYLRPSNLPGMFTAYKEPKYPFFVNNGRIAEYWKIFEDGHWTVNVQDSYLKNNVFSSKPESELVNVSDNNIPLRPYYNSRGFLLEIGSDN